MGRHQSHAPVYKNDLTRGWSGRLNTSYSMKNFNLKAFMTAAVAVGMCVNLASCSSDNDPYLPARATSTETTVLKLTSADSATRGTDLTQQSVQIVSGQQVGITTSGAKSGTDQSNVAWTAKSDGSLENTGSPVYYGGGNITVKAYHPYSSAFTTSGTFSVNEDQSGDGYLNSDLLWATATAKESDNATKLSFSHKLAKINVKLTSTDITDLSGAVVSICGTNISTTFDPSAGTISGATNMKIIKAGTTTTSAATATAIVIPQTVPNKTSLVRVVLGNKSYYYTLTADKVLSAGYSYTFTLAVKDESSDMDEVNTEITEWTNEDSSGNALANELSIGTAGTLSQFISEAEQSTITSLKVSGNLNSDDFALLSTMAKTGALASLDLSGITNTSLPYECFSGCKKLTSIILPETLTMFYDATFSSCSSLTSITIPASVTTIGAGVFNQCSLLSEVHILRDTTPLTSEGYQCFDNCSSSLVIYVPNSVLTDYQSNWSQYKDKLQGE